MPRTSRRQGAEIRSAYTAEDPTIQGDMAHPPVREPAGKVDSGPADGARHP
ncbi:MAG: hypothetical protein ABSD29_17455 [Verrucomicrobiota bacterium]